MFLGPSWEKLKKLEAAGGAGRKVDRDRERTPHVPRWWGRGRGFGVLEGGGRKEFGF